MAVRCLRRFLPMVSVRNSCRFSVIQSDILTPFKNAPLSERPASTDSPLVRSKCLDLHQPSPKDSPVSYSAQIGMEEPKASQLAEQPPREMVNVGAAAKCLGVSPAEVDRLCQAGALRAQRSRSGLHWIIEAASIIQWREANPNASASAGELESAEEQRAVPTIELAPCPRGACAAHWERRRRVMPEYRLNLCRRCFLGHPLPPKVEEEESFDAALYRAPVTSVQVKAAVSAKQEPVIQEAMEEARQNRARAQETMSVGAAAQVAGFSHDTMLRLVERGAIGARRSSSRGWWRIERASLVRFLKGSEGGG